MLPLAVLVLASAACSLGVPLAQPASLRIMNGSDISVQRAPYQAAVELRPSEDKPYSFTCAGAIISAKAVLTTATCVSGVAEPAVHLQLRVGSDVRESGGKVLPVLSVAVHDNFGMEPFSYDVAVITATAPMPLSTFVKPVAMVTPSTTPIDPGTWLFVTGWGKSELVGPNLSKHLKGVFVTPVPQLSCSLVYDSYEYVDDTMLCATGVDWAGICFGDYGGPLVDETAQLVGIASWGVGCGSPGYPGVYANLYNAVVNNWIRSKLT